MFFQKPIRYRPELFIPTIVAGLVAADQEQRSAAWIKCKQNPIRPSCMLDDELFHVGMARSRYVPNVRAPERGAEFFQKVHAGGNTLALFV